jgi:hypothetical protein
MTDRSQMSVDLIKRWKATEAVLNRACAALPAPSAAARDEFEAAVAQFREYISHNELELAFEELQAAAALANCRGGVWRDLERAAEFMQLHDRAAEMRRRFRAAPTPPA